MNKILLAARFFLAFLASVLVLPISLFGFWRPIIAAPLTPGNTYTVNSTLDTPAADASKNVCADANGRCTLRAAIMVANFFTGANTIILPAGVYTLTRPGYEDGALVGDLNISNDLTIKGAGSSLTIVDGNGAVTGDRVFKILASANNVTLSGMTIRNGQSLLSGVGMPIGGGGLYTESAGNLLLSDVILDSNTALNGGGLFANLPALGGSIELSHVIVRNNKAISGGVGEGGGVMVQSLSDLSTMDVHDSLVVNNTTDGTGGGFFVQGSELAHWSIERSQINSNTAASGGGIGNFLPLALSDSRLHGNHVSFDGGGIEAFLPLAISRTTLDANSANRYGGGIFDLATGSTPLYNDFVNITQSTLSGNFAKDGGGIYHDGFINYNSLLTLTNSTLTGNVVSLDGGGLEIYNGQAQLFNTTIAFNLVHLGIPIPGPGIGGGIYITIPAVLTAENTIIAKNSRGNGITLPTPDDCYSVGGTTGTLAFDLITTTTNCFVSGPQGGNIVGSNPLLGPLQFNGGLTQTQTLLPGSPAIDAGATAGCTGAAGAPITVDQRGFPRPIGPLCDIGAIEYNPNAATVFLPLVLK
jgi:CSLREA domain-containing protein